MKKTIYFIFWILCFFAVVFFNYEVVVFQVAGLAFLCGLVDIVFLVFFVIWIDKNLIAKKTEPEACAYDEGRVYQIDGCLDDYVQKK